MGAGLKPFSASRKAMKDVIPSNATWIQNQVTSFQPKDNQITLENGDKVGFFLPLLHALKTEFTYLLKTEFSYLLSPT